jgi:hypothetical protein
MACNDIQIHYKLSLNCELYDYCPVGANNVVLSAGADHELQRVSHTESHGVTDAALPHHKLAHKVTALVTSSYARKSRTHTLTYIVQSFSVLEFRI